MSVRGADSKDHRPALAPEERSRLAKESTELYRQAKTLSQRGDLAEATTRLKQALALRQRLYPADQYPQGHPDLAAGLNNVGKLLEAQGKYAEALGYYRQALAMWRKLYPPDKYPQGHAQLADSLNNLGLLLDARGDYGEALTCLRQALAMRRRLYPEDRYPRGHPDLAASLDNVGELLREQGRYGEALGSYRQALAMWRKLYPPEKYPQGHPDLAISLDNMGTLLQAQGEYGQAVGYYRQALAMWQKLYPPEKYPQGHPDVAICLANLAEVLRAQRQYREALSYSRKALQMKQKLYPPEKYPQGHPDLATSLNNLAALLRVQGEHGQALDYAQQSLAMWQKLYPKEKYPQGCPQLATGLNNLGLLLQEQGEYGEALAYHRRALAMRRELYPEERYPQGHPDLTQSLNNLALLMQAQGKSSEALGYYQQALGMMLAQLRLFAESASEAESLNLLASFPDTRDGFLTASAQPSGRTPDSIYALLWQDKSGYGYVRRTQQRLLRGLADDRTRAQLQSLLDTRRRLARLLLAPADPGRAQARLDRLAQLTSDKEKRERELATKVPALQREQARRLARPANLAAKLPDRSIFVDVFRYDTVEAKTRTRGEGRYAAFLLRRDQPVVRVELGDGDAPARAIEAALHQWRQDIANGLNSPAAEQLRRLVWEPLARHFPAGTTTVYLCPDGELSALPWAALSGDRKGTVLLDDYALALVPDGLALLEQLSEPPPSGGPGRLLLVGGVAYDDRPAAPAKQTARRSAVVGNRKLTWPALPATAEEIRQVGDLAGRRPTPPAVTELRGRDVGTDRVLHTLQEARVAHIATHGFFAAPKSDVRAALFDEGTFGFGVGQERRGAAARNPLVQSGLVLAGANVLPRDGLTDDGGILTAEAIAGADLRGLRLVVLSACETGLGETNALGQGVFGLQRAFHLGGCRDVVASLWKVDDEATAALMALFYRNLWEKGEPPIDALRHAQLGLMRSPQAVGTLARERGSKFAEVVKEVDAVVAQPKASRPRGPAPVKHWAAFVLSGAGR